MILAVVLTVAACARVHTVCDPLYAFEAYEQAELAYSQCLTDAGMDPEATKQCHRPAGMRRPVGLEHGQCDRLVSLCKNQGLW